MGEMRNSYKIVVKPEGKRSLWKRKRRWKDNINMYLRERRYEGVDWICMICDVVE
jgi:hypothetical protein